MKINFIHRRMAILAIVVLMTGFFFSCTKELKKSNIESHPKTITPTLMKDVLHRMDDKFYIEFYSADESRIKQNCIDRGILIQNISDAEDVVPLVKYGTEGSGFNKFKNRKMAHIESSYEQCADILSSTIYWCPIYKTIGEMPFELRITSLFSVVLKSGTTLAGGKISKKILCRDDRYAYSRLSALYFSMHCLFQEQFL